jgi:hypothetical protein
MDAQIPPASEAEGRTSPVYPEERRVNSLPRGPLHGLKGHESPVTSCKLFGITLLSENASANHLESHSCKNTGLKAPCFHTLTKNIRGRGPGPGARRNNEGVRFRLSTVNCQLCAVPELFRFHESPITSHRPLFVSPVASTLTGKLHLKPCRINTYKKQGEGGDHPTRDGHPERATRLEGPL